MANGQSKSGETKWGPGRRLPWVLLLLSSFALLGAWGVLLMLVFDALALLLFALDALALERAHIELERHRAAKWTVDVANPVTVRVRNASPRFVHVRVRDDVSGDAPIEPDDSHVGIPPFARTQVVYSVTPRERGSVDVGPLHVQLQSRLGLARVSRIIGFAEPVKVFPNQQGARRYDLAARLGRLRDMGVRHIRAVGGGGDFEQLREYVHGDSFRDLDWKSTAKRSKPITRLYQHEKSQTVLLVMDVGRAMATRIQERMKLDYAVSAALLLAHVALREGDKVGVVVLSDGVRAFVPPGRGPGQYRRILDALYGVTPEDTYVDFARFLEFMRLRVRRRVLMVFFTDLMDSSQAADLTKHAALLVRKHLPLCVVMRDPEVESTAIRPVVQMSDVFERAAALETIEEQESSKKRLTTAGVGLLEAPSSEMAVLAVNRYLQLKSRQAL